MPHAVVWVAVVTVVLRLHRALVGAGRRDGHLELLVASGDPVDGADEDGVRPGGLPLGVGGLAGARGGGRRLHREHEAADHEHAGQQGAQHPGSADGRRMDMRVTLPRGRTPDRARWRRRRRRCGAPCGRPARCTVGCALAMAYDVPAHSSRGRSLGMSPKAITSSGPTPSSAARLASVVALVTPAALISTRVPTEDQVGDDPLADDLLDAPPVVLRADLLVAGQQLDHRVVGELLQRAGRDVGRRVDLERAA